MQCLPQAWGRCPSAHTGADEVVLKVLSEETLRSNGKKLNQPVCSRFAAGTFLLVFTTTSSPPAGGASPSLGKPRSISNAIHFLYLCLQSEGRGKPLPYGIICFLSKDTLGRRWTATRAKKRKKCVFSKISVVFLAGMWYNNNATQIQYWTPILLDGFLPFGKSASSFPVPE